jgi:solute carrier family 25 carnitine/acylcarnitine transporter 20/29
MSTEYESIEAVETHVARETAAHHMENVQENALVGQLKSFAAGGFGGVCAVLVGHPFDLMKVRLQTSGPGAYSGTLDVVKKTIAADGIRGLYRGVAAPLLGVTPMFAISFWGYDLGQRIVRSTSNTEGPLSISQISAAGFLSAIPTTAVAAPFERVKVILQLQGQKATAPGTRQFTGALDVVSHLYKEGGLRSVFKGSLATVARDGPGSALYFATYEYLKKRLTPEGTSMSLGAISFAGGMAGVAMWVPVFPIDTIKSNLQSSDKPQSIGQVTKQIYRSGGFKAFFPGLGPALLRSFPANAATFLGVELAHKFFQSLSL